MRLGVSGTFSGAARGSVGRGRFLILVGVFWTILGCKPDADAGLTVAVSSNFAAPFAEIARSFEHDTGTKVSFSAGSTGKLCAQIENGAPFQVFLAADTERPARLERLGLAEKGSRVTYAVGKIVLYAKPPLSPSPEALKTPEPFRLAIASPDIAPYGVAAEQTLRRLELWQDVAPRIVRGHNVAQAFQFVQSGAARFGFIALSLVINEDKSRYWMVPQALYDPIRQDAVLLTGEQPSASARAFMKFLKSPKARTIIENNGYQIDERLL